MTATAVYGIQSVEAQKQRYSRELAAYTLRQWDSVRQAMPNEKAREQPLSTSRSGQSPKDSGSSSRISHGQITPLIPGAENILTKTVVGVQSIDFASRSRNGVKHEGRSIAAGNV
ncbi:hypothetical protein WOLCODRAFT_147501 [Wolfiporia cocos MD-104 SS10]|uniref:Uncharacterized protein n=1 Tax=Wolfiporia cocos (strain MD-104) TaxID=742152 RepID=A0A2H3IUL1_WOLCO|nr:hypothetical protein WOLCODRAFT_147501 [Wolfiporia cocos MD-104 SS10]